MEMTVSSILEVYTGLGGDLTDTYEDIAGGIPVAEYSLIPDAIQALAKIAGSTVELPAVSGADNGKVLKVIEGAWGKGTDESLPAVTSEDAGKILGVTEQGVWAPETAPTELPAVANGDYGKLLMAINNKWTKEKLIDAEILSADGYMGVATLEFTSTRSPSSSALIGVGYMSMSGQTSLPAIKIDSYVDENRSIKVKLSTVDGSSNIKGVIQVKLIFIATGYFF